MAHFNPMRIPCRWVDGYTLDYHTISSVYLGDDELGNPQFDTKRSEVGEFLYRLMYRSDLTAVARMPWTSHRCRAEGYCSSTTCSGPARR